MRHNRNRSHRGVFVLLGVVVGLAGFPVSAQDIPYVVFRIDPGSSRIEYCDWIVGCETLGRDAGRFTMHFDANGPAEFL